MGENCPLCEHEHREELEEKIAQGVLPKGAVARELGITIEDVIHHMEEHWTTKPEDALVDSGKVQELTDKRTILITNLMQLNLKLGALFEHTHTITSSTVSQMVKMSQEVRKTIMDLAQLEGELQKEQHITLIQFNQLKAIVISELCPACKSKVLSTLTQEEFGP